MRCLYTTLVLSSSFFRYAGHTPQAGYKCGKSFAPVTHELLTNPDVKKSGYSVLAHTNNDIK